MGVQGIDSTVMHGKGTRLLQRRINECVDETRAGTAAFSLPNMQRLCQRIGLELIGPFVCSQSLLTGSSHSF